MKDTKYFRKEGERTLYAKVKRGEYNYIVIDVDYLLEELYINRSKADINEMIYGILAKYAKYHIAMKNTCYEITKDEEINLQFENLDYLREIITEGVVKSNILEGAKEIDMENIALIEEILKGNESLVDQKDKHISELQEHVKELKEIIKEKNEKIIGILERENVLKQRIKELEDKTGN